MHIIDIHTHIYPEAIAQKATDSVAQFYGIDGAGMSGTSSQLIQRGTKAGISHYIVLPVAIRPNRVQGINDFIVQQVAQHDCFTGFGTLHAEMDGICEEAERIEKLGLHGIKMHPDSQHFAIDDDRLLPMYDAVQGRLPVMLHMGDQRYNYSHPIKLHKILEMFPRLEVIAAHFGGYSMYREAYELLKDSDRCIFDISSSMMFMPEGDAEKYIRAYGTERMAYGTDYPLWDPVQEVRRFLQLRLTDAEKEQIAHKTVERFLRL